MPFRLPAPAGPPAPTTSTNPFGIPSGLTSGPDPLLTGTTPSTSLSQSVIAPYFNPETGLYQTNPYSYGGSGRKRLPVQGQSVFGNPAAPVPTGSNPFGIPDVPWGNTFQSQGSGLNKGQANPFGISSGFQPPAAKQSTGMNESRENPYFNPETGQYQTEPYYAQGYTKLETPVELPTLDAETPSWTLDTVVFYDPTINNQDEAIKAWTEDPTKTYYLPDNNALQGITQEQWDYLQSQAPAGYQFTPWGWISNDYINSLTSGTGGGGYDYGGYTWGGGGGGSRKAMDQFYFGLMNWGI